LPRRGVWEFISKYGCKGSGRYNGTVDNGSELFGNHTPVGAEFAAHGFEALAYLDTNGDGNIDWKEFVSKFKTSDLDDRLKERAKDRMGRLKELMIMHMISPVDAFRFVSALLFFVHWASLEKSDRQSPQYP
jgi:hypothetical protein